MAKFQPPTLRMMSLKNGDLCTVFTASLWMVHFLPEGMKKQFLVTGAFSGYFTMRNAQREIWGSIQ